MLRFQRERAEIRILEGSGGEFSGRGARWDRRGACPTRSFDRVVREGQRPWV